MCLRIILAACLLPLALHAQVETTPSSPGIGQGLVARWEHLPAAGARPPVPEGVARLEDFSLALAVRFDKPDATGAEPALIALRDAAGKTAVEWTLARDHASLRLAGGAEERRVDFPGDVAASGWAHLVLSVRRDPRQALAGVWVNGVETMSWAQPPGALDLGKDAVLEVARGAAAFIADARLYDRALSRAEIQELGQLPPLVPAPDARGPFTGAITFDEAETIAVLGGSEAVALVESGWWEAGLLARHPGRRLRVRSLAWETDTVLRQDRPLNFGDLRQQLLRVQAGCVLLVFGRQECLERGAGGVEEFRQRLDSMLETCASRTRRLIVAGVAPFQKSAPPLPDLSRQNETLKRYDDALKGAARAHQAVFVDVWSRWPSDGVGTTTDGLNLSDTGARLLGDILNGGAPVPSSGALLAAVREKNKLWHEYWRPSNWAFLHGDRTAQPSSRDHLNPQVRWFPAELEKYRSIIESKENELWKQANEAGGKLP